MRALKEDVRIPRHPCIDKAPGATACAAPNVQLVSLRVLQAAMSQIQNRVIPLVEQLPDVPPIQQNPLPLREFR